jgi:hypothetical protein
VKAPLIVLLCALAAGLLLAPPVVGGETPRVEKGREGAWDGLRIAYQPVPDPIPLNELFRIRVTVRDRSGRPVPGVDLAASAVMPEHQHGMNLEPKVHKTGEGSFEVEGLLLHMPGRWWIRLDLKRDLKGKEEKTQAAFEVTLE